MYYKNAAWCFLWLGVVGFPVHANDSANQVPGLYRWLTGSIYYDTKEEALAAACEGKEYTNTYTCGGYTQVTNCRIYDETTYENPHRVQVTLGVDISVVSEWFWNDQCGTNAEVAYSSPDSQYAISGHLVQTAPVPEEDEARPCPKGENPVHFMRGEKHYDYVDFKGGGEFPIVIKRDYRVTVDPLQNKIWSIWYFGYQQRLYLKTGWSYLLRQDGSFQKFTLSGGVYQAASGNPKNTLSTQGSGSSQVWSYVLQDGTVETYNNLGLLTHISNSQGLGHTVLNTLDGNGRISNTKITHDGTGQYIDLVYGGGDNQVTELKINGAAYAAYAWMTNIPSVLDSVTYPDGYKIRYEYDAVKNSGIAGLVTGIFESFDGGSTEQRYSNVEYDTLGRATKSALFDGAVAVESLTFSYDWDNDNYYADGDDWADLEDTTIARTRVTNGEELATIYTFDANGDLSFGINGDLLTTRDWKLVSVDGEDFSSCQATAAANKWEVKPSGSSKQAITARQGNNGSITTYGYDNKNRVVEIISANTGTLASASVTNSSQKIATTYRSGDDSTIPESREFYGRVSSAWQLYQTIDYTYDSNNRLTSRTVTDELNSVSRVWSYTNTYYSSPDDKIPSSIVINGPLTGTGDSTTYTFNTSGQLASVENALGHETSYSNYNAFGLPQTITDVDNNVVTTLVYDARGRVISILADDGGIEAETTLAYYPNGLLKKITQPDGSSLEYFYNSAHHLIGLENNHGDYIEYTPSLLDGKWTVQEVCTAGNSTSGCTGTTVAKFERVFDALGRLSKIKDASGTEKQVLGYDTNNNLTTRTLRGDTVNGFNYDENDLAMVYEYDALDRLVRSVGNFDCGGACSLNTYNNYSGTVPSSPETEYAYNGQGLISSVTDANGHTTTFSYNGFGELTQEVSPDRGTTTYQYDAAGNLTQKIKGYGSADAQTITYSWDNLNRLTAVDYPGTDQDIAYSYDVAASGENCGEAVGRLCRVVRGVASTGHVTDYSYNALGRITAEKIRPAGTSSIALTTQYSYNAAGALTGMTLPGGRSVSVPRSTTTGSEGKITSVASTFNSINHTLAETLAYQPFGGVSGYDMPTEQETLGYQQHFNTNGQLEEWAVLVDGDPSLVRPHAYDAFGNLGEIEGQAGYQYDAQQRLTQAQGPYGFFTYQYDAVGNRTQMRKQAYMINGNGDLALEDRWIEDYQYATGSNRLETVDRYAGSQISGTPYRTRTFEYDGRGNIKTDERIENSATTTLNLDYGNGDRLDAITVDVQ